MKADPNICTHCPHKVIDIGRVMFCPCEDCHVGGLIQGREPSALTAQQPTPPIEQEGDFIPNPLH